MAALYQVSYGPEKRLGNGRRERLDASRGVTRLRGRRRTARCRSCPARRPCRPAPASLTAVTAATGLRRRGRLFPTLGRDAGCSRGLLPPGSTLGCGPLAFRPVFGCGLRGGTRFPLLGDLDGDPVLLRVRGNAVVRLQLADDRFEGLAVGGSRQGGRSLARESADEVLGGPGRRRLLAASPPALAITRACRTRTVKLARLFAYLAPVPARTRPLAGGFLAPTSPPPRLAHRPPSTRRRRGPGVRRTRGAPGCSSRDPPRGRRGRRSPRNRGGAIWPPVRLPGGTA